MKRAERFGTEHPEIEERKKRERAARFGIVSQEAKAKARKEKFKPLVDEEMEAKKKVSLVSGPAERRQEWDSRPGEGYCSIQALWGCACTQ